MAEEVNAKAARPDAKADTVFRLDLAPIQVVYNVAWVQRLVDFVREAQTESRNLLAAARSWPIPG